MKQYNLDQLTSIELRDKDRIFRMVYQKERNIKKFIGSRIEKEGFYSMDGDYLPMDSVDDLHFMITNDNNAILLWEKPKITLIFNNGEKLVRHFNTLEEAENKVNEIKSTTGTWKFLKEI